MLKQWLIDYSHDVLNGEIIACQKHKWACERFLRDIKREGTEEFPYTFNEEKALKFLKWMTLFKHTKGKLAGQNIEPAPIQVFVFGNIYGWEHEETGLRRFKKAYWQVARKNAKSQSLACVGSYEAFAFGENMSEVYIGATKTEQSKIVWNEIKAQVQGCDFLKGKYKIAYGKIEHVKSGSYITALSKDAGKTGDGLNVQTGIIDEYHAHKTSEIYDVLVSGMGARPQPLMMIITTAGFELQNPCYSVEYDYVSKILDPNNPIENEEYFVMVNELDKDDDIKDERNWEKANPILCSYEEGRAYLRGELKAALDVPEKMRNFLTKNMNIWVNMREGGYMDMSKWDDCKATKKRPMPDLRNKVCYLGIDLSKKIDLTSVSFVFPLNEGFAIKHHSFMPEDTFRERMNTDKVPYDLWVKQGYITLTPGSVVDYSFIESYIRKQEKENNWTIKEIDYDPYNATQFAQSMEQEGYLMVEIRQGIRTLGEPTKDFREMVYKGKIFHDGDPVLTWAVGNVVTKMDAQENIMLDKSKSTDRIDPLAATINAFTRARLDEYLNVDLSNHILNDDFSL
ncbi:terminase large subunit [Bacillus methanolicus]|uniref:terminase large subunit n=1 Tax=Bacillus methanolicus TaxID=1471 RepID=UPI0023806ACA|nr:terminase TerL endonuclease subunit [Bacillus methanolicus]MDE3838652.1 terminase large subunit [Bacillus methanolicus]